MSQRTGGLSFLLVLAVSTTSLFLRASEEHAVSASSDEVLQLLVSCPSWSDTAVDDKVTRAKIMDIMEAASKQDNAHILKGMEEYLDIIFGRRQTIGNIRPDIYNLIILTRCVFRVPERIPWDEYNKWNRKSIPPWWQRGKNGYMNLLWPLALDSKKQLILVGEFDPPVTGNFSNPIDEFLDFETRFGRRR
jgi:hypothetical protein